MEDPGFDLDFTVYRYIHIIEKSVHVLCHQDSLEVLYDPIIYSTIILPRTNDLKKYVYAIPNTVYY